MTALNGLVAIFLSDAGLRWQAYEDVAGVAWHAPAPVENADVADPAHRFSRAGRCLLAGFGDTDLPDGAHGAEAGTRRGNGGESGLTVSGDAGQVNGIAVVGCHVAEDPVRTLADQFDAGAAITVIADDCALEDFTREPNTRGNTFFRIATGGRVFFAEAFVDADIGARGPGTTTYVFYRDMPVERIVSMACRQA